MESLHELRKLSEGLPLKEELMPAYFIGHGSPMNALEDNAFVRSWQAIGRELPKPAAIICISAHWETRGTFITAMEKPKTIHDFGGFPQALFEVQYPAPGNPRLAMETQKLISATELQLDTYWGLDHGCWSILKHIYPHADVPVLQLSMDYTKPPQWHYELAKELTVLRRKGVLLIGSGNMVHNLKVLNWQMPAGGYDWAEEANEGFKERILSGDHRQLIAYEGLGKAIRLAVPTVEHYLPLLYILGLKGKEDKASVFNDSTLMGSLSMTSVKLSAG